MNFEDRLRAQLRAADASLPPGRLSYEATLGKVRRDRRIHSLVAVGAVAVIVAVASVSAGVIPWGARSVRDPVGGPPPSTTQCPTPTPSSAGSTDSSPSDPPVPSPTQATPQMMTEEEIRAERRDPLNRADAVVTDWLAHVESGEARPAWDLLSPSSQDVIGGFEEFKSAMETLQGRYGPWAEPPNYVHDREVVASSGEGQLVVVTLAGGTGGPAGATSEQALAVPVFVPEEGPPLVHAFSELEVDIELREEDEAGSCEPTFSVLIRGPRPSIASFFLLVGGSEIGQVTDFDEVDAATYRVEFTPPARLEPGLTAVTVVVEGEGGVAASAMTFRVP